MIQVKNITFNHSGENLYENASFSLPNRMKAGLVGLNGAGKSTLFDLLTSELYPDEGMIKTEGVIHLVPQEVSRDPIQHMSESVKDYLHKAKPLSDHLYLEYMANMEIKKVTLSDHPEELSGGQKTKLALLFAILKNPDILLLDEPTNFMDESGKKWVMHWLSKYPKSLLVVSHDLDLLDKHIHKVIYINKQTKKFEEYTGTYSKFKKLKADHDAQLTRFIKNQEQTITRMKKSVEKLRRSNVEKVIRQRVQLEKRIEKIKVSLPELPQEIVRIQLKLPEPPRIGELPLRITDLNIAFNSVPVLKQLSFSVRRNQRIALIGHNGAGKSTLIKIILGELKSDRGTCELDSQADIGYYAQELEIFDLNKTVFDTVKYLVPGGESNLRGFLAKFMFTNQKIFQRVGTLSGGEKTRLSIALLMLKNHNFLILDEPTTYLDVLSQKIILEALKTYTGTMLVVSHTPEFLKGLSPDKAILLPEENYVYWQDSLLDRASEI